MWGDFLRMGVERADRRYEEVPSTAKLLSVLEEYLDEYNLSATNTLNLGACYVTLLHTHTRTHTHACEQDATILKQAGGTHAGAYAHAQILHTRMYVSM